MSVKKIKHVIFLSSTVFFIFLLGSLFLIKSNVFADGLVGTHLGEGDINAQINIINNVLIPNGLEPGSPVTAMVDVNLFGGDITLFKSLAKAIKDAGYFPLIRVNGVCNTTVDPVYVVNTINSEFNNNVYISWGNEIGHWSNECNNGSGGKGWGNYVREFNKIKSMPNVSPSTLDYYGKNAIAELMAFPGMAEIFATTRMRAAVAYGCVYDVEPNCDPSTTVTQKEDYEQISGPFYLTEFSLGPNNNPAPDTNLKKVIEFIQTRSQETGALKITPLVRNVCNNDGHWLLYINGKLFTKSGIRVSEDCQGSFEDSNYNLDQYPEYNVNDSEFYLTPISQVDRVPRSKLRALRKELSLSGYESYCAANDVIIEPKYNTDELIKTFIKQHPSGVELKSKPNSIEELDYTSAQYPIWRDTSNKQFLLSSLEEYFGFKDVYEIDPAKSEVNSAAANSLLSNKQACVQGWKNIDAQQAMCKKLTSYDDCALLPRPIPDTDFTVKTLLQEKKLFETFASTNNIPANCETLISEKYPQWNNLTKGLINTPSYFDRAYRYGFVVAVIHTLEKREPLTLFNFFTEMTKEEKPRDEVLAVAFKLPDIGTNKGDVSGEHISVSQFWRDPLDLTRRVLTSNNQEQEYIKRRDEKREKILDQAMNAGQGPDNKIFCYDGDQWPPDENTIATDTCKNELPRALVDIINGKENTKKCGDSEAVNVIRDLAGLGDPNDTKGKVFTDNYGGQVLLNLFKTTRNINNYNAWAGGIADPRSAKNSYMGDSFESTFLINKDTYPATGAKDDPKETTADFYLVYPVGFELEEVEKTLKGTFFSSSQIESMSKREMDTKFGMTGQTQVLNGGGASHTFVDTDKTENKECGVDINGDPINCNETFNINIVQGGSGMSVLGGKLGWWLRQIQASLNSTATDAYKYFRSCSTTEDFLLGRC